MDGDKFDFKVGIIGPTRVGKTSLVTAILEDSQKLLAGTPVSIEALGTTKARIKQHKEELRGSLMAGEFDPGHLAGTQEPFVFELALSVDRVSLRLAVLDYPGAWLVSGERTAREESKWQSECEPWLEQSSVLLIPIDAAVGMESTLRAELTAAHSALQISEAEEVARRWAKARKSADERGLLILAPLKCESYFNDNGGIRSRSEDLQKRVSELYGYLLEAVRQEAGSLVDIQYQPVDTFGCVEIKRAEWKKSPKDGMVFQAEYLVRPPGRVTPKGADGILIAVCKHLVESQAGKDHGLFGNLWRWLTGEKKRLSDAVVSLAQRDFGSRVKSL
jgi:hypothetical protein